MTAVSASSQLVSAAAKATRSGPALALLQRKCGCGSSASKLTNECEGCQRENALGLQPKLAIGAVNDPLEHEADRVAERVMRMSGELHSISPQRPLLARRATNATQVGHAAPASVHRALRSAGEPLPRSVREYFEPRFGHDFARVRVHHDAAASHSARDVNAEAYTLGDRIAFASGRYAPHTVDGRVLIAHELAHVVQQGGDRARGVQRKPLFPPGRTNYRFDTGAITLDDLSDPEISMRLHAMSRRELRAYRERVMDPDVKEYIGRLLTPQPVAQIETESASLPRATMEQLPGLNYWEQRTLAAFDLQAVPARMGAGDERDAVYAALWQVFPQGAATPPTTKLVTIPPNRARREALLYELTIGPPAKPGDKPQLQINFLRARPGSVSESAPEPPKNYIAPELSFTSDVGFPESADRYFATHREERRQVAYWIKLQRGEFEQLVVTKSAPEKGKGPPRDTLFLISGRKEKSGAIAELHIELRPGRRPVEATPPEDYRQRDYGDLLLEQAQTRPHPEKGDTLGYVNLAGVPPDELLSVKYTIARYFTDVKTRDAEVDALVPIAGTKKEVYYSLRFRPDNEVDVERIGEKGTTAKLDPTRMDIARARGFDANSADPAKLKSWLGKRYPGIKPTGTTVEEVRTSANQSMQADAGTTAWYQSNYKITVIDGVTTQKRLRTVHGLNAKQTPDSDNKDFTADELRLTELALQTLTEAILKLLRFVRLGRKKSHREADGTAGPYGGQTFYKGAEKTVVMYDNGLTADASAFRGGAEGVNLPQAMLFTHEFGHVVESATGARKAFAKFIEKTGIRPFTRYAESKPETDFFAEAFAISQTDPQWLRSNHPAVAEWFETLNRTGKPPK